MTQSEAAGRFWQRIAAQQIQHRNCRIRYNAKATVSYPVTERTAEGHIVVSDELDLNDADECWLWDETCGMLVTGSELGLDEYWEVV